MGRFSYNFGYHTLSFGFFGFPLAREIKPPSCFMITSHSLFIVGEALICINYNASAMDTRWSIKVRHADHETTQSSLSPSIALSNRDDARRWTCQSISFHEWLLRCCAFRCKCRPRGLIISMNNDAVRLLDTPKFDTFYRVLKKAFENKRSSRPLGHLHFGASLILPDTCGARANEQ